MLLSNKTSGDDGNYPSFSHNVLKILMLCIY